MLLRNEGSHFPAEVWASIIQDYGTGIELQDHEKVFGLIKSLNDETAGTGVGLSIVKTHYRI